MNRIDVREETMASVEGYARISTAFRVARRLVIVGDPSAPTGVSIGEESVASPFIKDYDAVPDNRPSDWVRRFDTSRWRVFAAFVGDARIGGAILIPPNDRAVVPAIAELWDLRVDPAWRRCGVARTLWATMEAAAIADGASALEIETQHINVAACRLYQAHGGLLASVDRSAYPLLPDEVRLRGRKALPVRDRAT